MGTIRVLPDIVVNKIAAGEVIERPASVVKELVENAIDAGATAVTVEIENGGMRLIRVSDNGTGMGREDALLAIERHATSKITDIDDVSRVTTLGFRGEALPSIVSVSHAMIDTRRDEDTFGTRVVIEGGVLRDVTDAGRDTGTVVEVRGLFYNLPARRKFLKTEKTEVTHIKRILYDTAVASYGVSLDLISGGKSLFSYRGVTGRADMLPRIFGATLAGLMLPIDCTAEEVVITGFVGKPETARGSSSQQFMVMNGRPIASRSIMRAVADGYGTSLGRGMYPVYALYFETDPERVDVNVHPAKREVRIHREYVIYQALRETIARTLHTLAASPGMHIGDAVPQGIAPRDQSSVTMYSLPPERWHQDLPRSASPAAASTAQLGFDLPVGTPDAPPSALGISDPGASVDDRPAFWQLKDRYIISTIKEGAVLIDQHAAHERVLYEELLGAFSGAAATSQQLLFPLVLDFPASDFDILQPMLPFLERVGFGIREFGDRTVVVDAVPAWIGHMGDGAVLGEYIDEMRRHGRISSGYTDRLAAAMACRSAIKAGTPLGQTEMRYLLDRLFATKSPFTCPHGRPTVVRLTIDELDRRFGR